MTKRLLVMGGGVAGAAAAARSAEYGATITWVKGRAGASALGSGAADLAPWTNADADEPLSQELERFASALGAWKLGASSARVVSAAGVVRRARARDPLVLDLTPHAGGSLGVAVHSPSSGNASARLGAALREQPWIRATSTTIVDVAVESSTTLELEPPDLDAVFARIAGTSAPSAWLVPARWIGDEGRQRELERRVGRPIGCALTELGGFLGSRLAQRLEAFAPPSVEPVRGEVVAIEQRESGAVALLGEGAEMHEVEFDVAVVCVGGVGGGGIVRSKSGGLRLSFELPDVEFELYDGVRAVRLDAASEGGVDFCALGHAALPRLGVRTKAGKLAPGIYVAGETRSDVPRTLLAAAQSALDVVDEIFRRT